MIEVRTEEHGDVMIMHIKGEFYIENIQTVENTWNELVARKPKIIAINCHDLEFIDSSAIGTLVKFLNNAMNKKIKLIFYDLSKSIQQIFETARLNNFFTVTTKSKFETQFLNDI
ncbi:MAG TPA: STAS domain-containing protein [Spirochaetota bacterium]|nr:STAS domain-containing protein [Spirochaetota bacterium]HNT10579.1 STAS domain-containing protein [Spirochaetota bacterium]HNV48180.1 STAS domain-containing protein [Spirochaetota bacterium]HOS41108.1 STAS domain-containing protein [Spirochaetota bacterium]HPU89400.1 STAS domain-containing protein [Spirochaetota bacterium]